MKLFALLLVSSAVFGQNWTPQITNSQFETRAFSGDLQAQLRASTPSWFGYAVKAAGDRNSCCWEDGSKSCGCRLEEGKPGKIISGASTNPTVQLEASPAVDILFRVANNNVDKVRAYSLSCSLDGGGLPFVWLSGVSSTASLKYLQSIVDGQHADSALMAISTHEDPEADVVLARVAQSSAPEKIREQAIFWIGASRGPAGIPVLKKILGNEPSEHLRDKAVFALSINKAPEALTALIQAAKSDPAPHVRGQAIFWLAQKAGKQASGEITDAIQNDPDTSVKKSAVFALSQLPKDEGVPKLIEVARNQKNPEVRKQAFFWLGQSGDPRALSFIEQVVLK